MAYAEPTINILLDLFHGEYFKGFESVIEMGAQDLNFHPRTRLLEIIRDRAFFDSDHLESVFNIALRKSTPDDFSPDWFFKLLGFRTYSCVDADGRHDAYVWDLNAPIPPEQKGRYDLITNNGTTEHVFNVAQVFKNIHDLAKPGSIMIHILPFQGYVNHGFYNYQPCFFDDIAYENKYEILLRNLIVSNTEDSNLFARIIPYDGDMLSYEADLEMNVVLCYVLRKTSNEDFRIPFQGIYDPFLLTNYRKSFLQKLSQNLAMAFFKGPNSLGRRLYGILKK